MDTSLNLCIHQDDRSGREKKHPVLNVKYYAHRGFHGEEGIPENSMAAFKKAKGSGYGIELDVQLTKDGVMVVHHDYDLKRTCGVNKKDHRSYLS